MEQIRREYIYYSDRKINDRRQQISQSRWDDLKQRLSGVEVTVLGSGAKISMQPSKEETILTALQKVWADLDDLKKIGTFDEPKEYAYGKLVFKYGILDMFDPPLFVLAGATDRTIVVLGGQKQYVRSFRDREIRVAVDPLPVLMESEVATRLYASNGISPGWQMAAPDEELSAGLARCTGTGTGREGQSMRCSQTLNSALGHPRHSWNHPKTL